MYLENINETHVFSSFGTTFINSQAKDVAKTITFTEGYNLDSNLSFKVLFENGHITSTNTAMTLNNKNIKVYIRGTLSNLPTHVMTINNATVYTSLQEGTILELFYNGSSFVIVGNPIIYSNDDYEIYANGDFIYKKKSYTNLITANGENNVLLGNASYSNNNYGDVNVSNKCSLTFNPSTGTLSANSFSGTATTACKGWNGSAFANFGSNAFNSTAFTTCTGTVTSVNVSVNGVSGTAVTSSGTITLNNVNACNSECFGGCTYAQAKEDIRNYKPACAGKADLDVQIPIKEYDTGCICNAYGYAFTSNVDTNAYKLLACVKIPNSQITYQPYFVAHYSCGLYLDDSDFYLKSCCISCCQNYYIKEIYYCLRDFLCNDYFIVYTRGNDTHYKMMDGCVIHPTTNVNTWIATGLCYTETNTCTNQTSAFTINLRQYCDHPF